MGEAHLQTSPGTQQLVGAADVGPWLVGPCFSPGFGLPGSSPPLCPVSPIRKLGREGKKGETKGEQSSSATPLQNLVGNLLLALSKRELQAGHTGVFLGVLQSITDSQATSD